MGANSSVFRCMATSHVTDSIICSTPHKFNSSDTTAASSFIAMSTWNKNKYILSDDNNENDSPLKSKHKHRKTHVIKMRRGEVTMNESTDEIMSSNSSFETILDISTNNTLDQVTVSTLAVLL